jgi:hypothetical protein
MDSVFLLWYVREVEGSEDELLIGVYSTQQEANAAIERLKSKPGFVDCPTGFQIHPHSLNRDGWSEGFTFTKD